MYAAFAYTYPVNVFVREIKFKGRLNRAAMLGNLLQPRLQQIVAAYGRPDMIVPVPLHPLRLMQRGFNQANELIRVCAKTLEIPVQNDVCYRQKPTPAQTLLDRNSRKRNLRGAFVVKSKFVEQKNIVVFDDVITTGSTTQELTKTLVQAGANSVAIWALARQTLRND